MIWFKGKFCNQQDWPSFVANWLFQNSQHLVLLPVLRRLYLILFNTSPSLIIYITDKVLNFRFLSKKDKAKVNSPSTIVTRSKGKTTFEVVVFLSGSKEHIRSSNDLEVKMIFWNQHWRRLNFLFFFSSVTWT